MEGKARTKKANRGKEKNLGGVFTSNRCRTVKREHNGIDARINHTGKVSGEKGGGVEKTAFPEKRGKGDKGNSAQEVRIKSTT